MAVAEINRITPEEIQEARDKTGLRVVQSKWGDGVTCGCALTILAASRFKPDELAVMLSGDNKPIDEFIDSLKLDYFYAHGFVAGFDGCRLDDTPGKQFALGFQDGEAARKLIIGDEHDVHELQLTEDIVEQKGE